MTTSSTPAPHPARRPARNALVAALSAATVAFMVMFALAPTSTAMVASTSTSSVAGKQVVFYGEATDSNGKPVRGARVEIYHVQKKSKKVDRVVKTNAQGQYRVTETGAKGRYYVQVSAVVKDKHLKVTKHFSVAPGHAYRVSVQVVKKGIFAFLPVTHY